MLHWGQCHERHCSHLGLQDPEEEPPVCPGCNVRITSLFYQTESDNQKFCIVENLSSWWKLVWSLWLIFCFCFFTQIWDNRGRSLQPLETGLGVWKDQGARVSRLLSSQSVSSINCFLLLVASDVMYHVCSGTAQTVILTVISSLCVLQDGPQSKEEHFCNFQPLESIPHHHEHL